MIVFYDSQCPVCARSVEWIRHRTDSAHTEYIDIDEAERTGRIPTGLTPARLRTRIHVINDEGNVFEGLDAIREVLYRAKASALANFTDIPGIKKALGAAYEAFARHRPRKSPDRTSPRSRL